MKNQCLTHSEYIYEIYFLVNDNDKDFEHEFIKATSGSKAIKILHDKYVNCNLFILYVKRKDEHGKKKAFR